MNLRRRLLCLRAAAKTSVRPRMQAAKACCLLAALNKGSSEEASLRIVRQKMQAAEACCLLAALNLFHCERHVARHGSVIGFDLLVLVFFYDL